MATNFTFGQSFAQGFSDARKLKQQAEQFALQQVLDFARLEETRRSSTAFEGIRSDLADVQKGQLSLSELINSQGAGKRREELRILGGKADLEDMRLRFLSGDPLINIGDEDVSKQAITFLPGFLQSQTALSGQENQLDIARIRESGANRRFQPRVDKKPFFGSQALQDSLDLMQRIANLNLTNRTRLAPLTPEEEAERRLEVQKLLQELREQNQ